MIIVRLFWVENLVYSATYPGIIDIYYFTVYFSAKQPKRIYQVKRFSLLFSWKNYEKKQCL